MMTQSYKKNPEPQKKSEFFSNCKVRKSAKVMVHQLNFELMQSVLQHIRNMDPA